jgi:predicted DNA-binding ribbon-helix-helix protein
MPPSRLVNRNIVARRGRTSMRLEPELWAALEEICRRETRSLAGLVQEIEEAGHPGGRTSAVRVHVVAYFRRAATEDGHAAAGHGAAAPAFRPAGQESGVAVASRGVASAMASGPV